MGHRDFGFYLGFCLTSSSSTAGMEARIQTGALTAVGWSVLCVRSMHRNQKGFKSPVNRMNIEEQKKLLTMKSTTRGQLIRGLRQPLTPAGHVAFAPVQNTSRPSVLLRKGDRAWEGRLWEICQTMNKKLIRGRLGGTRWHNTPKFRHSAQEVNETFGQRRFQGLPTEW